MAQQHPARQDKDMSLSFNPDFVFWGFNNGIVFNIKTAVSS